MSSGVASREDFYSFNGNQMNEMYRYFKTGHMTVEQLSEHWGHPVEHIQRILDHEALAEATKKAAKA